MLKTLYKENPFIPNVIKPIPISFEIFKPDKNL